MFPLHDFALMLQATAPVPLAGEDLRGRARGGLSAVQHDITAPPEGTALLSSCIKPGLPCSFLSLLVPGEMLSNVHPGKCRQPPQAALGAQQACAPVRVIKTHNHGGVGTLGRQGLHCNHMLSSVGQVQCLEHLLRCLLQACRAFPREAIHHHIGAALAPLMLLRQHHVAAGRLLNVDWGLLDGLLQPCPAGDECCQLTLVAWWLCCSLYCVLG